MHLCNRAFWRCPFTSVRKTIPGAQPFKWKYAYCFANQIDFQMKGSAPRLILKQRLITTRKWHITIGLGWLVIRSIERYDPAKIKPTE